MDELHERYRVLFPRFVSVIHFIQGGIYGSR